MGTRINQVNRLEEIFEYQNTVEKRATELVSKAINSGIKGFKERFDVEVFSSVDVLARLMQHPEWQALEFSRPDFFKTIRKLGWVRCVARIRGQQTRKQRLKLWIRQDRL